MGDYPVLPLPYQPGADTITQVQDPERYFVDWFSASSLDGQFVVAHVGNSYHFFEMHKFQAWLVPYEAFLAKTNRDEKLKMEDFINTEVVPKRQQWGFLVKWCLTKFLHIFVPANAIEREGFSAIQNAARYGKQLEWYNGPTLG